jgi:uncharacterized membrane protein YbhN (UPF0104 family)
MQRARASSRTCLGLAAAGAAIAAVLGLPALARVPGQVLGACAGWITLAIVLELLSIAGFVVTFKLVFAASTGWRRSAIGGLRALGASGVLPAGGLVGPVAAAASIEPGQSRRDRLVRSASALVILTNTPGVIVLVALGLMLALGWVSGPHDAVRSLIPAALAAALIPAVLMLSRSPSRARSRENGIVHRALDRAGLTAVRDGVADARSLLLSHDSRLVCGVLAYFAFDTAVLWAAFRAGGHAPAVSVVVMGYLVGSLASIVPIAGGFGAVEGGLIGALALYGAPAGRATAAVLLYRAVTLLLSTVLGSAAWGTAALSHRSPNLALTQPQPSGE